MSTGPNAIHQMLERYLTGTAPSALALTAVLALPVVGGTVLSWSTARATTAAAPLTPVLAQPTPTPVDPPEVTLTLRPEGFVPAELLRPAGKYWLTVDNRSGVDELTFVISRNRKRLRQVQVRTGAVDWSELIDLPKGRYTVSEVNHSHWVCHITVQ